MSRLGCRVSQSSGGGGRASGTRRVRGGGWKVKSAGPVLRMVQGAAWIRRWWWPQTKIMFSSEVGPPLIQCSRWWAWHISGGRVQCGNRQCWSRATRAFQIAGVTRRRRRPTSRTSDLAPRTAGMTSASQHNRRTVEAESCSPVSVVATPANAFGGRSGSSAGSAVGLRCGRWAAGRRSAVVGSPRPGRRASGCRGHAGRVRRDRSPAGCRWWGRRVSTVRSLRSLLDHRGGRRVGVRPAGSGWP